MSGKLIRSSKYDSNHIWGFVMCCYSLWYCGCCSYMPLYARLVCVLDLPVCSPLCHSMIKTLQRWEQVLLKRLEIFGGPPSKYISTHPVDGTMASGPALLRHKALFEPSNTPFRSALMRHFGLFHTHGKFLQMAKILECDSYFKQIN